MGGREIRILGNSLCEESLGLVLRLGRPAQQEMFAAQPGIIHAEILRQPLKCAGQAIMGEIDLDV
jgi:hypothetical protein